MRKWGVVTTVVYTLIIALLVLPGSMLLSGVDDPFDLYESWLSWVWLAIMAAGYALLLFLRVDIERKRLKPRQHVWVSIAFAAVMTGLLFFAAAWSLLAGILGDAVFDKPFDIIFRSEISILLSWITLWIFWAILFALSSRVFPKVLERAASWLMKGSILELLIAVPCHIVVRHREDCSAPIATGFGIATGVAMMLLTFGPGILFLYRKRMKKYET